MRIAFVGCGYVADYYFQTLRLHPEFELVGVYDIDQARLAQFMAFYGIKHKYGSLEELLADDRVELVLNLTNPRSHYDVSMASLKAGKHVYSEKPLAMQLDQAHALVAEAESRGLQINSAPCTLLGEAAQTLWKALREGHVGQPRLVYANMDDGMPFKTGCHQWRNRSGAPWPWRDEFEVGVVMEHAGYALTWLVAFLGPIRSITGASSTLYPDKMPGETFEALGPDTSLVTLHFNAGVTARLCCSIVADDDRSIHIYGSERTLICDDFWRFDARVYTWLLRPKLPNLLRKIYNKLHKHVKHVYPKALQKTCPPVRASHRILQGNSQMDFMCGPAELAASVREARPSRLSPQFCLHVNEAVVAISNLSPEGGAYRMTTSCDPIQPMPWAM